jgi:hypothetical protein
VLIQRPLIFSSKALNLLSMTKVVEGLVVGVFGSDVEYVQLRVELCGDLYGGFGCEPGILGAVGWPGGSW